MLYATVIISIFAMISLTATAVYVAATSRQSVSDAFRAINDEREAHKKELFSVIKVHEAQTSDLLNRLMTVQWENYAVIRESDASEEGEFVLPEHLREHENEEMSVVGGEWGGLRDLRAQMELSATEEALLREDFGDEED